MSEGNGKTSTGIQPSSAGLLCYLGWWITGIIFFVLEKENKFVRFHAIQSIIVFGLISVFLIVFSPLTKWVDFIKYIALLVYVFAIVLWIAMIILAAQGKKTKLPWAGNLAEKYANVTPAQTTQPQPLTTQQPPVQPKEDKKD